MFFVIVYIQSLLILFLKHIRGERFSCPNVNAFQSVRNVCKLKSWQVLTSRMKLSSHLWVEMLVFRVKSTSDFLGEADITPSLLAGKYESILKWQKSTQHSFVGARRDDSQPEFLQMPPRVCEHPYPFPQYMVNASYMSLPRIRRHYSSFSSFFRLTTTGWPCTSY